jgi:putative transposase
VTKDTSRLWRRRWLELSAREVPVMERPMMPPSRRTQTPLILNKSRNSTIACNPPEQYGRPISHWSSRELADELIKQAIVESISERQVGRYLEEADLKPHRSGYWLNPRLCVQIQGRKYLPGLHNRPSPM